GHPCAVGNLAHRKALVDSRAGTADADPFISLHAGTVAFDHLDIDDHGVAGRKIGNLLAGGKLVVLLFFELLDEVHCNLHRRRAQPTVGGSRLLLPSHRGIGGPYKARSAGCHPFGVLFGAFWRWAHKSGRRARVRASASPRRQAATLAWSPDKSTSGIGRPSKV